MKDLRLQKIFKNFNAETKMADGAPRTLIVKISTINPDRGGDTVQPKGMDAENFMKNPVVLYAHNYSGFPIGKCTSLKVNDDCIMASVEFPPEGMSKDSDLVYNLNKIGHLNAWSIGFSAKAGGYEENEDGGYNFKAWELLEFSSVPVPMNAEALTVMRSKGIDVDRLIELTKQEKTEDELAEEEKTAKEKTDADAKALADAEKKDADNPKDPGYTDDTKITALTVAQLKNLIDKALDAEEKENDEKDSGKTADVKTTKAGRAISAKHEKMLKDAHDHMTEGMKCIKSVLESVSTQNDDDNDPKDDEDKGVRPTLTKRLYLSLVETDKQVGLALRLAKIARQNSKPTREKGDKKL